MTYGIHVIVSELPYVLLLQVPIMICLSFTIGICSDTGGTRKTNRSLTDTGLTHHFKYVFML